MADLFSEWKIKNCKLKNRIVFPAMVAADLETGDGQVTPAHLEHFRWVATRGVGLIVTGAVCVDPEGKLNVNQLAVWSDDMIPGLSKIAEVCHETGTPVLMQIHHGGFRTVPSTASELVSSSDYEEGGVKARALTKAEIAEMRKKFTDAAIRAKKAGFDGVELHCAHLYLLDEFLTSAINKRTDEYGGSPVNRARIVTEMLEDIRIAVGQDFILSCRMGCNTPTLEDAQEIAALLEKAGADLLDISYSTIPLPQIVKGDGPKAPQDFGFNGFIYGAKKIRERVDIPVCAVWQVGTEEAAKIVEEGCADLVAVLRSILVDPDWVEKAKRGEKGNPCYNCRPVCKWFTDRRDCPAWKRLEPEVRLNQR